MNRQGKQHCEVEIDGMPVARVAGEEAVEADEIKRKKPVARPIDVATRLLQLVSLFVLFVFGLVGASIFTLRPSGMSHPVLHRGTSLVVNRLTKQHHEAHGHAARYSPPVHFSLVVLRHNDDVAGFAKRFAPDFFVLETEKQAEEATSIEQVLPDHTCIATTSGARSSFCFDRSVWSEREHGVRSVESKHDDAPRRLCTWEVSRARFEREVSTRSASAFHGRHWQNETLTIAFVRHNPAEDTGCDHEATLVAFLDPLRSGKHSSQAPIVITGLPSTIPQLFIASVELTDPFEFLLIPQPPSSVLANSRMRPVSASVMSSAEAPNLSSPVSVVYELLPPQRPN